LLFLIEEPGFIGGSSVAAVVVVVVVVVQQTGGKRFRVVDQILGSVAPFLDHGFLDSTRILLGVHADLLWYFHTVGFRHQSKIVSNLFKVI